MAVLWGSGWAAPRVVVSIPPVHSLVAAVMEGVAEPDLVYQATQSPHASSLSPSQARAVSNADAVIWLGREFESSLGKLLQSMDPAADLNLLTPISAAGKAISLADPHRHDKGDHSAPNEGHASQTIDPHIWLSPDIAADIVNMTAASLGAIDPQNAETYSANARQAIDRIHALSRDLEDLLAPLKGRAFIVYHDAYRYFERETGLKSVAAITMSPEYSPGARHLGELTDLVAEKNIRCVFSEPQFQPRILGFLEGDLGLEVSNLDPLGTAHTPGPDLWFSLMRDLAESLAACLSSTDS